MFKANNQPGLFSYETQLFDNEQQNSWKQHLKKHFII